MKLIKNNIKLRYVKCIFIGLVTFLSVVFTNILCNYNEIKNSTNKNYISAKAKVIDILYDNTNIKDKGKGDNKLRKQEINIKMLNGKHKGELFKIRNTIETIDVYNIIVSKGDEVLVNITEDNSGEVTSIKIYERVRDKYVYILITIFILSLVLIGGIKGIQSVVTLSCTGIMIFKVLLPLINNGYNPILVAVLVCVAIATITFLIVTGINKKTLAAVLGTLSGVFIAGILALTIGNFAKITGLASEHAQTLALLHRENSLNFKGILFSAIIIGALGAVMDVAMSVASSMNEILEIKPSISKLELIKSGMNIGKDIMGTMSNTLILAYTGGAIQLLLLLMSTQISYSQMINLDLITSEVITALSGSIGLIWSIPFTVIISATINKGLVRKS
ncbi:YibE/F family protein [Clostridium botulinum D str. 1873]|uniref:YibE/F family protein n=1 Tax=Clostridium botulinum D str. 1873 TaxID=592027 RepID=A0A9P2LLZ9_CLOBO|nr:YibE/F family protein [Clostridium botulinum]EES92032.1 YibE/F family protein [Clostridium botulinum D str. 1873]